MTLFMTKSHIKQAALLVAALFSVTMTSAQELPVLAPDKAVKTGGYEQTRLIDSQSMERYYRFDSKYFYMQGFNYMLNLYFRF